MKKLSVLVLVLCCCLCMNGFIGAAPVAPTADTQPDPNSVKASRFQNMLNINTVYGDDFLSNQKLVNAAMIVLKDYADEEGFVESSIVTAYIKDMYDVDIDINEKINEGFPQKDGYILLIPRGYSIYNHTVKEIQTLDDYILVTSSVVVSTHDGETLEFTAETKFIENEGSTFGYSILDSVLIENPVGFKM